MKALLTLICALVVNVLGVVAQTSAVATTDAPGGIVAVKFSWSKERMGWERDPFGGPIENFDEMRVRARNEKRILDAKKGGNEAEVNKAEREARADAANIARLREKPPSRYGFLYRASVQNNGTKTITSIDWDYVFFDAATQSETGRRQFTSVEKIAPGKTRELKFFIGSPPTLTISADALNDKEREGLIERIVFVRVEYSDGSVWLHP